LLNRTPGGSGVEAAGRELSGEAVGSNWLDDELNTQSQQEPEDASVLELNNADGAAAQEPQPSPKGEGSPLDAAAE